MKIFGLACLAAVNPKLLGVDLILMGNRRPRLMFVCFQLGGMGLALTVRPEATEPATLRFKDWLIGHARQLVTAIALLAGGYMVISGTLRLLD